MSHLLPLFHLLLIGIVVKIEGVIGGEVGGCDNM